MALSASKGNRKPYKVEPLIMSRISEQYEELMRKCADIESLKTMYIKAISMTKDSVIKDKFTAIKDDCKKLLEGK
jgi:hypothetical protein